MGVKRATLFLLMAAMWLVHLLCCLCTLMYCLLLLKSTEPSA